MTQIISYCSEELMTLVISLKSVFTGSGWFFLVMHVTDERPRLREVYYLTWCTAVNLSWKASLHNSRGCDMIIKTDGRRLFHGFVSAWTAPSAGWGVKSRWQTARLHAHTDYMSAANHMNSVPDRTPPASRCLCQSFWLHCGLNKYNNPVVAMKNLCVCVNA